MLSFAVRGQSELTLVYVYADVITKVGDESTYDYVEPLRSVIKFKSPAVQSFLSVSVNKLT